MLYGTARFCIECLRGDSRGSIPFVALSPAQLISLALIVLGGAAYAVHTIGETRKRERVLKFLSERYKKRP